MRGSCTYRGSHTWSGGTGGGETGPVLCPQELEELLLERVVVPKDEKRDGERFFLIHTAAARYDVAGRLVGRGACGQLLEQRSLPHRVNEPNKKLDAVVLDHFEDFRNFLYWKTVQEDAVQELDVCIFTDPFLYVRTASLVETFDQDDATERRLMTHLSERGERKIQSMGRREGGREEGKERVGREVESTVK